MALKTGRTVKSSIAEHDPDFAPPTFAKVVATIGPASDSPDMLARLIEAGVNVFRLNFSHGTLEDHAARLRTIRATSDELSRIVGVLGDLAGPKLRISEVPEGGFILGVGQDVELRKGVTRAFFEDRVGEPVPVFGVTIERIIDEVRPGQRVLINDGAIRMLAVESEPGVLRCRVLVGGEVTSRKGINLPETDLSLPSMTDRDHECLQWAVANGLDFLALSFVRTAAEVRSLKETIRGMCAADRAKGDEQGSTIQVIAKIEKPQALDNIDAIVAESDAIMVARGDLGVEMDLARVPVAQKKIIECCEAHGTPVIVATQMLETMIDRPIPTRAEASDVANAIFDNTDAVMLSGETAVGKFPEVTVRTMRRIIAEAESHMRAHRLSKPPMRFAEGHSSTAALARGAWQAAADLDAAAIVCWSQHGGTARYLSQNDFQIPILAYSSDPRFVRRMTLLRGVTPVLHQPPTEGGLGFWNRTVDDHLVALGLASPGDWIALLAGRPLGVAKRTNTLTVHRVGEEDSGYMRE